MNKEQFKNSISNLINYYVNSIVQLNLESNAQPDENVSLMIASQANALGIAFNNKLNELIEVAFAEKEEEEE